MAITAGYEWSITPPDEGMVSVVVRMSRADAAALIAATTDSATTPPAADSRAVARPVALALQAAVAAGELVVP